MSIINVNSDERGCLAVLNLGDLPFMPKRFFWIFENSAGLPRAGHAHKSCEQFIFCQSGQVLLEITEPSTKKYEKRLLPGQSFYLPKLFWLEISELSPETVLGVFASETYDRKEYIDNYSEYLNASKL